MNLQNVVYAIEHNGSLLLGLISMVMIFADAIRYPENLAKMLRWIILLLAAAFWYHDGTELFVAVSLAAICIAIIFKPK